MSDTERHITSDSTGVTEGKVWVDAHARLRHIYQVLNEEVERDPEHTEHAEDHEETVEGKFQSRWSEDIIITCERESPQNAVHGVAEDGSMTHEVVQSEDIETVVEETVEHLERHAVDPADR